MGTELALQHLLLRLRPINRLLRAAVARVGQAATRETVDADAGLFLTPGEATALLDEVESLGAWTDPALATFTAEELEQERALQAAAAPGLLPLEALRAALGLSDFELECLLLCAAPEVSRGYERLFGFILDDLNRRAPCVELLCSLSAHDVHERHARREVLASHGRLVRCGLLRLGADTGSEWRRELRLSPEALAFLLSSRGDAATFRDPAEVRIEAVAPMSAWGIAPADLDRAASALRAPGGATVSIHGPRHSGQAELPRALAARACLALRHLAWNAAVSDGRALQEAAFFARHAGAALWVPIEKADPAAEERVLHGLESASRQGVPLVVSGRRPFRSLAMMGQRPWIELAAAPPSLAEVEALWSSLVPELLEAERAELALAFRLSPSELQAAVSVYRSAGGGGLDGLKRACRIVARRHTERFATVLSPTRGAEDLILPEPIHRAVLDVARFATAWPRIAEQWGMGRMHRGAQGVRALFTGPSGTGKTLAAEVIAGILGQELHKVDLAQVVSKWVGETEKNLDAAFDEAEQGQAVLFFDEADALFSKRGEVRHGTDRYANLEVSYLLQRLEEFSGVVIIASNLKENIDEAFSRRFQVAVEFPRPSEAERRRLWSLAFPSATPVEGLDLGVLARLDMTGATIMNAARTAALLAACDGQVVRPAHIVEGIAREYRRESRLLLPAEIAPLTFSTGARS